MICCVIDWPKAGNIIFQSLTTGLLAFIAAWAGIVFFQRRRAKYIGSTVVLEPEEHHGSWTNLRIYNGSPFSMHSTCVYVTIRHQVDDVEDLPIYAMIHNGNKKQLYEDRICWSLRQPGNTDAPHFIQLDVHPHERQTATFLCLGAETGDHIAIVSEMDTRPYRIFLKKRQNSEPYHALIKVVSADSLQASWEIEINPSNSKVLVKVIRRLNVKKYEQVLGDYQSYYNKSNTNGM
jgi:hypothetical protein